MDRTGGRRPHVGPIKCKYMGMELACPSLALEVQVFKVCLNLCGIGALNPNPASSSLVSDEGTKLYTMSASTSTSGRVLLEIKVAGTNGKSKAIVCLNDSNTQILD